MLQKQRGQAVSVLEFVENFSTINSKLTLTFREFQRNFFSVIIISKIVFI